MWDILERWFGEGFMPHGHCYLWSSSMVGLQVGSNVAIGAAYVFISGTLYYIIRRIRDVPFSWMFLAFGVFIITCGGTHFTDAITVWHPIYWFDGGLRAVTAVASVGTAILMLPIVPKAIALAEASRLSEQRGIKLEQMYEELARAHATARALERAKTDFFANVSHELRTPLTLIMGPIAQLAADATLGDEQRTRAALVARNAAILLTHVGELLEIAKVEAGQLAPTYARADLAHLVRLTGSLFEGAARDQDVTLDIAAPAELPVELDVDMMRRVLQNLLSNAFKHAPRGGRVRCSLRTSGDAAVLEIEDNGPGISDEFKTAVFERFRQVSSGGPRTGGTGLGLSIVKELVLLHQGSVIVEDGPGGGARFRVELPRRAPAGVAVHDTVAASPDALFRTPILGAPPPAIVPAARATAPDRARPLLLVVEDNADMRWFLRDTLSARYDVALASDGEDGLAQAMALRPDLVVTDMMMPRMDGSAFVRAVRARPELAETPIVVLSARADEATCVKLLHEGANDYAVKPFSGDELLARVANLVSLKRVRDVLAAQLETATGTVEAMAVELAARNRSLADANRDLTAAKQRAEVASAARDKFMNLVSHEIRTPLTSLQLQLALLGRAGPLSPRQSGYASKMLTTFAHLNEMMSSLLEYATLQGGGFTPSEQDVDIGALTRDVVARYARAATDKGLELRLEVPHGLPLMRADPHLVNVLLAQLVSNAVRHTPSGSVTVTLAQRDENVCIDIRDTGPGIPTEYQEQLFRAFEPLEDNAYKHTPGLGIGLALAKRVALAVRGSIDVVSRTGAGSTFTAVLPLTSAAP